MAYKLLEILNKCDVQDIKILMDIIDNRMSFTNDRQLQEELNQYKKSRAGKDRDIMIKHIEKCIRYFGSSDLAYFKRYFLDDVEPAGKDINDIIVDVSRHLKVRQILLGSVEASLANLVKSTAEQTFFKLSPEEQRELFDKAGLSKEQQKEFLKRISENKALFFPILLSVLGPKLLQEIITGIAIAFITNNIEKATAQKILTQLGTKIPWWSEWFGPVVWSVSVGWLIFDIQSPAYRKTVPLLLYLGIVSIRNGSEEGVDFWGD